MKKQRPWNETEQQARVDKLLAWWEWERALYDSIIPTVNTGGESGFDPDPSLRPCEHRLEWMRGKLCLACDNTGWRKATDRERKDGLAFDPYALELPKGGWRPNESESAAQSARGERIDRVIELATKDLEILFGERPEEEVDRPLSALLQVIRKPAGYRKYRAGMLLLRERHPDAYDRLPARESFLVMALLMYLKLPGKVLTAPVV